MRGNNANYPSKLGFISFPIIIIILRDFFSTVIEPDDDRQTD